MRRLALLIFALTLLAAPATANAAVAGGLKQFPGTAGCFSDETPVASGCAEGRALAGVGDVVVSPDGKNAYVSSRTKNAIAIFDRNTSTGRLTQKSGVLGCITVTAATVTDEGCNLIAPSDVNAMTAPSGLAVSPDGKNLYVVTERGRLGSLNRASDGTLSFNDSSNLCGDTCTLTSVAVSPDGKSVYPAGTGSSGIIAVYRRNTTAGSGLGDISGPFPQAGFVTCYSPGTCGQSASNLGQISDVVVTPDNKQLLLAIQNQNAVLAWDRTTSGANQGDLAPGSAADHCVSNGALANCTQRQGIITPQGLAVTDSGSRVIVSAQQAVATFTRNAGTGALTPQAENCFGYPTSSFPGCTPLPASTGCCTIFYPNRDIAATPDSKQVYIGTESSSPTIWGFNRPGGTLTLVPSPLRCTTVGGVDGCSTFRGGNRVQELFAATGNRHVYGGGDNRVWGFEVDRPPVCSNVAASGTLGTPLTVALNCSDPDGDALTFQKVSGGGPTGGSLADSFQGNTISYNAFRAGSDSFKFRVVAAGVASDPATASLSIGNPPPPPTGGGGGGGGGGGATPQLIPSTVTNNWLAFPRFTTVTNLSVNNLLAGSTVRVTCKTKKKKAQRKGCPYKSKRFTASGARAKLNLRKPFRKKRVPVGTKITITVTVPGQIGKRFSYTMRKRKLPKKSLRCIAPDGKLSTCS